MTKFKTEAEVNGVIDEILKKANATTGENDITVLSAVEHLIKGYGQGSDNIMDISYYDILWDAIQANGARTNYEFAYAGSYWTNTTCRPKHPMNISFAYEMFRASGVTDLTNITNLNGEVIPLNFENCSSLKFFAYGSKIVNAGVIRAPKITTLDYSFAYASDLKDLTLETGTLTSATRAFIECYSLENFYFTGIFNCDIDLSDCPNLTKVSAQLIFSHIKDNPTIRRSIIFNNQTYAKFSSEELSEFQVDHPRWTIKTK